MPYTPMCPEDDGEPAAFILTNVQNGETVTPCLQHAGSVFWSLAQALGGIPDEEPPQAAQGGQDGRQEAEAGPAPARPKRGRTRRQGPQADPQAEASPFPDATPVD